MNLKQMIESRLNQIQSSKAQVQGTFVARLASLSREAQRRADEEGAELPMCGFLEAHMDRLQELREEFGKLQHTWLELREALAAMELDEASVGNAG